MMNIYATHDNDVDMVAIMAEIIINLCELISTDLTQHSVAITDSS